MNGCGHIPGSTSGLYNWQEVTPGFLAACSSLKLGELCHDDMFGLFEAMSAIEMMDPKMDAGMVCNRANSNPMTWDMAVEKKEIILNGISGDLDPGELITMIDETLACFVTWLEGHSLAQTVLTNLYLHNVDLIECPVVKPLCIVVLKLVELVKDIISKASVYEEEDFQPLTYGFRLCQDVTDQRCIAGLREAEENLAREMRRTKPREGVDRSLEEETKHQEFSALHARTKLLRLFYCGLNALFKGDAGEGCRIVGSCAEILSSLTAEIGNKNVLDGGRVKAFEPLANQRLLPPTFPRYTEIVGREQAFRYLDTLVTRLNTVTAVITIPSFHAMLDFFQTFSATSPCVLSRSVLQLLYTPLHSPPSRQHAGSSPAGPPLPPGFPELLRDSCKSFMAPPCLLPQPKSSPGLPSSPLHTLQVKLCLDTFFSQCCRPFGLLLQATGHNRARQRDKISQLLEEFSTVQEEADRLDNMLNTLSLSADGASGKPHSLYLGTWLLYHVLKLMVRYILSGFELELYSVHEWPMIFWYLYELLYPWLINCLHRADTVLTEHYENVEKEKRDKGGKGKKKAKSTNKKGAKLRPLSEIACYQAHANMCAGYYKLMVAAKQEKKILLPNPQFDNEVVRYEHRFGAFANLLTPPLMPYSQYKEVLEHTEKASIKALYTASSRDFGQARQILETVQASMPDEEVLNLITINKTNFVVASVLARDSKRDLDFEFSMHQNFPTVKLV